MWRRGVNPQETRLFALLSYTFVITVPFTDVVTGISSSQGENNSTPVPFVCYFIITRWKSACIYYAPCVMSDRLKASGGFEDTFSLICLMCLELLSDMYFSKVKITVIQRMRCDVIVDFNDGRSGACWCFCSSVLFSRSAGQSCQAGRQAGRQTDRQTDSCGGGEPVTYRWHNPLWGHKAATERDRREGKAMRSPASRCYVTARTLWNI